jgi:hypothetical protein
MLERLWILRTAILVPNCVMGHWAMHQTDPVPAAERIVGSQSAVGRIGIGADVGTPIVVGPESPRGEHGLAHLSM